MTDIDELQRRITAAMDRVATGLGQLNSAGGDSAGMQQALDDEKTANAQLQERIKTLTARQETELAELRAQADEAKGQMAQLDADLQRLRKANGQLRQSNQALREANEAGVGEPHLINKAMLAELESLRAARAADVAEASSIINALTPLLDDAATTAGEDA